ncbi:MAG: cyclic nucleotide-binding domain-containing protein, partial [Candidatus Marinimicrobia bacterium]|nr:cyclic nucleotide-binding domain-containing protein [Candidatus Neomarinimicrobiota bacterium]
MRELRFNPGEVIIKENSFGSSAYILKSGSVDVTKKAKNRDIVLATLEAEEIFGELGLIDDRPRSASVIAKTCIIVDEIVRDDFLSLLEDKAKFVIPILKTLFERLRQANETVVSLENQLEESAKPSHNTFVASVKIEGLTEKSRS